MLQVCSTPAYHVKQATGICLHRMLNFDAVAEQYFDEEPPPVKKDFDSNNVDQEIGSGSFLPAVIFSF